jgi:hypothetical protein
MDAQALPATSLDYLKDAKERDADAISDSVSPYRKRKQFPLP